MRKLSILMAGLALLGSANLAFAWPDQQTDITLTLQGGVGGSSDTFARITSQYLAKHLPNSNWVVVNLTGAGGEVAYNDIYRAPADGSKINMATIPPLVSRLSEGEETAYTLDDFEYLGKISSAAAGIAVSTNSPYQNLQDLVEAAKANPGQISMSVGGIGNDDHLAVLQLMAKYDIEFNVIPFETGAASVNAVLGGHVQAGTMNAQEAVVKFKDDLRTLAVFSDERLSAAPDVPTATEQGYDVVFGPSRVFIAPAGIPDEVAEALADAIKATVDDAEYQAEMDERGFVLDYLSPAESEAFVRGQLETLTSLYNTMPWK